MFHSKMRLSAERDILNGGASGEQDGGGGGAQEPGRDKERAETRRDEEAQQPPAAAPEQRNCEGAGDAPGSRESEKPDTQQRHRPPGSHEPRPVLQWVERYRPGTRREFAGRELEYERVLTFLKGGAAKRAVLLAGRPGTGKTSVALAAAAEADMHVLHYNMSDTRNQDVIERIRSACKVGQTYFLQSKQRRRLVVLDEVDGAGGADIASVIKSTGVPVVCIANNKNSAAIKTISSLCEEVVFRDIPPALMVARLKRILALEGRALSLTDTQLRMIADKCCGDMRAAVNQIQMETSRGEEGNQSFMPLVTSEKRMHHDYSIFKNAQILCSAPDLQRRAFAASSDFHMNLMFVHDAESTSAASECRAVAWMSDIDVCTHSLPQEMMDYMLVAAARHRDGSSICRFPTLLTKLGSFSRFRKLKAHERDIATSRVFAPFKCTDQCSKSCRKKHGVSKKNSGSLDWVPSPLCAKAASVHHRINDATFKAITAELG